MKSPDFVPVSQPVRLIGPLAWQRYELELQPTTRQQVRDLTEAGYGTVESSTGLMLEPGFVHSPEIHAAIIGRVIGREVTVVLQPDVTTPLETTWQDIASS